MDDIVNQYDGLQSLLNDYCTKVDSLIKEVLHQENIKYHKIESRVKNKASLRKKIERKSGKYKNLNSITDLVGIRIIAYFEDDVDKIASILEREFDKDNTNSVDKRQIASNSFGYKSLHYVLGLTSKRKRLTEYRRFSGYKFEVQIRSILQHAWAEIEHDLGYKLESGLPAHLRRDFSRVSALLEIADVHFVALRDDILSFEEDLWKRMIANPSLVPIDEFSLKMYYERSPLVQEVDRHIVEKTNSEYNEQPFSNSYTRAKDVEKFKLFKIRYISDLNKAMDSRKIIIADFAKAWAGVGTTGTFSRGVSLFYLFYVLACEKLNVKQASDYFNKFIYKDPTQLNGEKLIKVMRQVLRQQPKRKH